jgi:replicative DNA helicase Mcm
MFPSTPIKRRDARLPLEYMVSRRSVYTPLEVLAESYINNFADLKGMLKYRDVGARNIARDDAVWTFDVRELEEALNENSLNSKIAERVLNELDTNPEKMMEALHLILIWTATEPGDEEYPDFILPQWKLVHADRWLKQIGAVSHADEGHLATIKGTLLYLSDPIQSEYISMQYLCNSCNERSVGLNLVRCTNCDSKQIVFDQNGEETIMRNFQEALVQENIDDLAGSPASISVRLFHNMINRFTPGDRITITGYVRMRDVPNKKNVKKYEIDALTALLTLDDTVTVTPEDREEILRMSKEPDVLAQLAKGFLPEIVGHDEVKQAIILQAVKGMKQKRSSSVVRDRIHILLAGDPGEAKSQFLLAHRAIHEKSMYISDTSKAGITVSVADIGGKRVLSPGIMVLSNGGVACLDELDKMQKDDREGMHTAMEQGVISKMKAGLRGTFAAETSVLAACNPKNGRFNLDDDIPSQLNLEATLMDRFDLVFWFIADSRKKDNIELAMQVLKPANHPNPEILKKYIHEAMRNVVVCEDQMLEEIAKQWNELKTTSNNPVSIGFRALEGMRRIAEASAKIRFSPKVEKIDVDIAVNLIRGSWGPLGYDTDALRGFSLKKTALMHDIVELLRSSYGNDMDYDYIYSMMTLKHQGLTRSLFDSALQMLKRAGEIYEPFTSKYRRIS